MKMLFACVSIPLTLLGWWGYASISDGEAAAVIDTHEVQRRNFLVTLQEKGELKAADSIDIKCELEGRSTIISLVDEGTAVEEGDLLVELASDEIANRVQQQEIQVTAATASLASAEKQFDILQDQNLSNIRKAKLKLELAQLALTKYQKGDRKNQLGDAKMRLGQAREVLKRAEDELESHKKLFDKAYIPKSEYDQKKFERYKAQKDLEKAERDLWLLEEYTFEMDEKQKLSDVGEAEKEHDRIEKEAAAKEEEQAAQLDARRQELVLKQQQLAKLRGQMQKTKIRAPSAGLVVYGGSNTNWWRDNDQIKEGAEVRERQTILRLPDTSHMKVSCRIHEAQTANIRVGQTAQVMVEGIEGRQFTGEISKIAVMADSQSRWTNPELKEFETEILIHESDSMLKPGGTAHVTILIDEREDVVTVPIQAVFRRGARSYVFGHDGARTEPIEVELGMASEAFVEVTKGLAPGQHIMLAVSDDIRRELPEMKREETESPGATAAAQKSPKKPSGKRGPGASKGS